MSRPFLALLFVCLPAPSYAQALTGELLLNSWFLPDVLVHYRLDGTVVQTSSQGTGSYYLGAAILPNGNWVTTRMGPYGVNIFDGVTGAETATWDVTGFSKAPGDVGVFSDGTLAVVDKGGSVWRFDQAGNVISSWKVSSDPNGILVDERDHVWTCDMVAGLVWHTDDQGNKINEFSTGGLAYDATMAEDGTLFVALWRDRQVVHYAQDGTFLGSFYAVTHEMTAIAMGRDQTLWVTGPNEPLLRNFDQAGTLLGSIDLGPAASPRFLMVHAPFREDIGQNYCGPANFNSTGKSAIVSASGSTRASDDFVTLAASQLPSNVFGYFLNSDVQGFSPFPPGSSGNLCLGGGIGRHSKQVGKSDAAGGFAIDLDLTALPRPGGSHSVLAGETWNFQCWFRDNQGGPTSNFTDGIEIVFN